MVEYPNFANQPKSNLAKQSQLSSPSQTTPEPYSLSDAKVRDLSEIKYMLDTDICSYIIKNHPSEARKRFHEHLTQGICISDITLAELCYGVENHPSYIKGLTALLSFLALVKIIPFGSVAAEDYGKIRAYLSRKGTPIGGMDMLIAAHARSTNLILVTNNTRHYSLVPQLLIENWTK